MNSTKTESFSLASRAFGSVTFSAAIMKCALFIILNCVHDRSRKIIKWRKMFLFVGKHREIQTSLNFAMIGDDRR